MYKTSLHLRTLGFKRCLVHISKHTAIVTQPVFLLNFYKMRSQTQKLLQEKINDTTIRITLYQLKPLHSNYLKPWLSSLRCCVQETKLHSPLAMNRAHKIECKLRSGDGTGFVRLSSSNQASFETKNKTATSQQLFNSLLDLICSIIYQLYEATLLCYQKTTNPISKKFTILYLPKVKNC